MGISNVHFDEWTFNFFKILKQITDFNLKVVRLKKFPDLYSDMGLPLDLVVLLTQLKIMGRKCIKVLNVLSLFKYWKNLKS